jgi:hypothetical protein
LLANPMQTRTHVEEKSTEHKNNVFDVTPDNTTEKENEEQTSKAS